jgi:hypothetical protein
MKNLILMLMLAFLYGSTAQAQITRGAQPAEIYISTDWYIDYLGDIHYAIFHSTDNGEHITLKYENIEVPPPGEMQVGKVLGDATPGALYNYGWNELWVSFDYGENWEYNETYGSSGMFASGCINGEIYKCCVNPQGTIWRSIDYGNEFVEITQDAKYVLEVGVLEGNLFGRDGNAGIGYNLHFSTNYGEDFITIPIDSAVAFYSVSGYHPRISRGTEPGELYLVSWWPDYHYKIFHSTDTGYTWTEKFESDYIDIYFWRVKYTAGREPGSFYALRSRICPAGDHIWLFIDYSSDYGETFTTYFHDLDSTITSVNSIKQPNFKLSNYPNPFSNRTIMNFYLPNSCNNAVLNIYDIKGILIRQYDVYGKNVQQWDGCNSSGITVKSGLYFYQIKTGELLSPLNKLLFIN